MTSEERRRLEREQERTRRKVLAAELALLLLLRRGARSAAEDLSALALLDTLSERAILSGREKARSVGLAALTRELRAMGLNEKPTASGAADVRAARRAARGIRERAEELWGREPRASPRLLVRDLDPTLSRAATTETFDAFADERRRAVKHLDVIRIWDATLDRRTCPKCEGLHGTEVGSLAEFPDGDPPLHPRCRCVVLIEPA